MSVFMPTFAAIAAFVPLVLAVAQTTVRVETAAGPVLGFQQSVQNVTVSTFYGIPYAKPPVGTLRFRFPEPVDRWTTPRECFKQPNTCYQEYDRSDLAYGFPSEGVNLWNPNTKLDEDCLYLNVWSPAVGNASLPVMIWIYGGAFISGSSTLDLYQGHLLAARQNVVVVSMQYRVRTLGFLFLNSSDAPGNAGLADQLEAIKWVNKNVHAFGGDPNRVTLFGESAGGASVAYQLLIAYQQNTRLFQYAIMQSACALGQWSYVDKDEMLRDLDSFWNCTGCAAGGLKCLYTVSAELLTTCGGGMLPTTDFNGLVPARPSKLMASRRFLRIPVMLGVCQNEGSYFVLYNYPELINYSRPRDEMRKEDFSKYLNAKWYPEAHAELPVSQVKFQDFYLRLPTESSTTVIDRNLDAVEQIWGDRDFKCPIRAFGLYYAMAGQPTYMYLFKHRTASNPWPSWTGVLHADEIEYVFGRPLNGANYTTEERRLSDVMQAAWANFAKYGDPSINGTLNWPKFGPDTKNAYVILDGESAKANSFRVSHEFRKEQCEFLSQYPEYSEFRVSASSNTLPIGILIVLLVAAHTVMAKFHNYV